MTEFPSSDLIPESFLFKIQDLDIWYNPTVFSSVSALIRTETLQFPLLIKQFSQGKLKLKNKHITNLQCLYDINKHKYLPLKIQVDITLQYKGGKTLTKRFLINLNQFKTGINKSQRIKILKSVERMFSVEISFKLENTTSPNHPNESQHSIFKNQSRFSSYRSNELSAMRQVRVPKTQIQQVKSLNAKEAAMKSPKRMSDFIMASKKNAYHQYPQTQESALRSQKNVLSPNKEQYKHYLKHLDNGVTSEEVEIKNSYVAYVQGDPYILEEHKLYAESTPSQTNQIHNQRTQFTTHLNQSIQNDSNYRQISSPNNNSTTNSQYRINHNKQTLTTRKIESSHNIESSPTIQSSNRIQSLQKSQDKQMNSLLLEEIKDLRKKLSDLLYEKNKLYTEKQNNLLQYETRDKQQKIKHKKQLADQKQYYQDLLKTKQIQIDKFKNKWSQIPTRIKEFDYFQQNYQMETLDDSSQRNVSIALQQQLTGRNSVPERNSNYRNQTTENNNYVPRIGSYGVNNRQKKRIFQSSPLIKSDTSPKSNTIIINDRNGHNNKGRDQENIHSVSNLQKPVTKDLQDLNEIESSLNIIVKLKEELSDKNQKIEDLLKYKELAHEQEHELSKLNELINDLNLQHHQELANPQFNQSHAQLQEICAKLSDQIQLLEQKILFLEQTNTTLNQEYNNKLSQLNVKQSQLNRDQQQVKILQKQLNNQITKLKLVQNQLNEQNQTLNHINQQLHNRNEQITLKEQQLDEVSRLLKNKQTQIDKLKNQKNQLMSVIEKLNQKINHLIEINSSLYQTIQNFDNQIKHPPNQHIILHNYHLNPTNQEIFNLTQQQTHNQGNSHKPVKVPSILRVNSTQSIPQRPSTNTHYILVNEHQNQNRLNNSQQIDSITQKPHQNTKSLETDMDTLNHQNINVKSLIRNNYHQETLINEKHLNSQAHLNPNTLTLNQQIQSQRQNVIPNSILKASTLNSYNKNNPNPNSQSLNQPQTITIDLSPPHSNTTKLVKIQQTPQRRVSDQQYPNETVKISHQNTPRPVKYPSNSNYTHNENDHNKNSIKSLYHSAQKQRKASTIGGRTYRSTRNQKKRTRNGDDSEDCGCC